MLDVGCWMFPLILLLTALASDGAAFSNADCLDCHLDPSTTRKVNGKVVPLVFPTNAFAGSIHAKLFCTDCHRGIRDLVHESKLPPANCAGCHDKQNRE